MFFLFFCFCRKYLKTGRQVASVEKTEVALEIFFSGEFSGNFVIPKLFFELKKHSGHLKDYLRMCSFKGGGDAKLNEDHSRLALG